jgi:AraC family transcriptional regulator, positive regulator of tynA and feaB
VKYFTCDGARSVYTTGLHGPIEAILGGSAGELVESADHRHFGHAGHAAESRVHVDIWSTDAARAHERFSYWREAICRWMFNISIEAAPERFSARLAMRRAGSLRLATSESTGYRIVRGRRDIDSAPADHYAIYLQQQGRTAIEQGGETFTLQRNDIAISDGRHPFRADFSGGGRRAVVAIPHDMIHRRAPWLGQRPLHRIAASARFAHLARDHLLALTAHDAPPSDSATIVLADNLCNLLALASADDMSPSRLHPDLQLEALLAFCRQHLHDSDLSPHQVAAHFSISVRTLHSRFERLGLTFGRWLLEHRLDACRVALRDDRQRASNISEIAYRWGFNDLSHFNKAFRERFKTTPREWRNGEGD